MLQFSNLLHKTKRIVVFIIFVMKSAPLLVLILLQISEPEFTTSYWAKIFTDANANVNKNSAVVLYSNILRQTFAEESTVNIHALKETQWMCNCWNATNGLELELECYCEGESLVRVPQKLDADLHRLTITSAGLSRLRSTALSRYAPILRDISLTNLHSFERIQPKAFSCIKNLRTIYISHAPKLAYISKDVFYGISSTIKTIRIIYCGLVKFPDMRYLPSKTILHMVDLEGNQIRKLASKAVRIKTEQLILDNNALTKIDASAFYKSEIAKLSLKNNMQLQYIHPSAFFGIMDIQYLDLSSTALVDFPSDGLQGLEILRIQNTHSLKTIPSIYNFKNLQVAWLTHSFHCCAFEFPSRHDPSTHAKRLMYLRSLQKLCLEEGKLDAPFQPLFPVNSRKELDLNNIAPGYFRLKRHVRTSEENKDYSNSNKSYWNDTKVDFIQAIRGSPINTFGEVSSEFAENQDFGEFHNATALVREMNNLDAVCGNLTEKKIQVSCFPMPNALNPCEDVMGFHWLRIFVWIVVLFSVFGNFSVLVVLLSDRSDSSVPKFLMQHLAFADLCMGFYLFLIACIDVHSKGEYFNYAFDWQYGVGCKVSGFLTVFAYHLSLFTLTVITLERWLAITRAMNVNKRIKIRSAKLIMTGGWLYSLLTSSLPLFGISNYSSTSICLPMEARDFTDIAYLTSVLGINGTACFIIAISYIHIYFSLGKETRRGKTTTSGDMSMAKKMSLLVFTNFLCWTPIAFFGATALAGHPLIDVTRSKVLLVFFYPLNSFANPYLYALLTEQYRRQLYVLLARFGLCKRKTAKYEKNISTFRLSVNKDPRQSKGKGTPETTTMLRHASDCV